MWTCNNKEYIGEHRNHDYNLSEEAREVFIDEIEKWKKENLSKAKKEDIQISDHEFSEYFKVT